MKRIGLLVTLISGFAFIFSCQKELSYEKPSGGTGAVFTLKGAPGACDAFVLSGGYATGVALNSPSNNVAVTINVTTPGSYSITTTAVNGIVFSGAGNLTATGDATIVLIASGTPAAAGDFSIPVTFGSSSCSFPLTVGTPTQLTIDCATIQVNGIYTQGEALTSANTVTMEAESSGAGSFNISGTLNGMTFAGSGTFTAAGKQTVTLVGTGTPVEDGDFTIQLNTGTSTCDIVLSVLPGTPPTGGEFTWEITGGGTTYSGPTSGAATISIMGIEAMTINGRSTTSNESLIIAIGKTGSLTTGDYVTGPTTSNSITLMSLTTPGTILSAGPGGGAVTIKITTLDLTNDVVEGTFSGTAKNATNGNVTINGKFKAEIL